MEIGKYFESNQERVAALTNKDWQVALSKCKTHIRWRLRQKTLSGAHHESSLGSDPVDHYLGIAYEKILTGEWEWKNEYSLIEQLIRIVNSHISKEVEKTTTSKSESFSVAYKPDIESEFYDTVNANDEEEQQEYERKLQAIENAVQGDIHLEIMVDGLKEGKKRAAIAEILEISLRQFDKLREKLIGRVRSQLASRK